MGKGKVDFDRGIARLASYARIHGHANPKIGEVWLEWRIGLWVSHLRAKYRAGKLNTEQVAEAESIGLRFSPPYRTARPRHASRGERRETELLRKLALLMPFYLKHGHINVRQHDGVDEWIGAGRWIARLRGQYRTGNLTKRVILEAEALGIDWNPKLGRKTNQIISPEDTATTDTACSNTDP